MSPERLTEFLIDYKINQINFCHINSNRKVELQGLDGINIILILKNHLFSHYNLNVLWKLSFDSSYFPPYSKLEQTKPSVNPWLQIKQLFFTQNIFFLFFPMCFTFHCQFISFMLCSKTILIFFNVQLIYDFFLKRWL